MWQRIHIAQSMVAEAIFNSSSELVCQATDCLQKIPQLVTHMKEPYDQLFVSRPIWTT